MQIRGKGKMSRKQGKGQSWQKVDPRVSLRPVLALCKGAQRQTISAPRPRPTPVNNGERKEGQNQGGTKEKGKKAVGKRRTEDPKGVSPANYKGSVTVRGLSEHKTACFT